jgi:hypothetical protein
MAFVSKISNLGRNYNSSLGGEGSRWLMHAPALWISTRPLFDERRDVSIAFVSQ